MTHRLQPAAGPRAAAVVAAWLVMVVSAPAHATLVEWDGARPLAHDSVVAPKAFVEICARLRSGRTVDWRYDTATPIEFNIHFHVGKAVEEPVRQSGATTGSGRFTARADEVYCWMWLNRGASPARLSAHLEPSP